MSAYSADLTRPDLPAGKRKRRRWPWVVLIIIVALAGLVVIGDRVAAAYAEDRIATEIQKEGFGAKPHAHMTARNVHEGPLTISSIKGTVRDVRVNSGFNAGTIGSVDGTATVGFGNLAKAAGQPDLALKAAGKDKVSAEVDLGFTTATATAQVTKVGNQIRVRPISVEGFPLSDLDEGDLDFTVPVTGLPMGLKFESLTVSSGGVSLRITGSNIKFSG
jgi:hypothetical protein